MYTENRPTGPRLHVAICAAVALAFVVAWAPPTRAASAQAKDLARKILSATGVKGGLVVHLGCGNGRLTAALRVNDRYLVQGLDADARNVDKAREHVRSLGLYGAVSVDRLRGDRLPYADNIVDLLVGEDLGEVRMKEVRRVLAPNGVAYIKVGRKWTKASKPRPGDIDEWTHYLHDASGNAVAHDEQVGPPRRLQWVADPPHTRGHEYTPSINAVVSAGGRIFYVADEGPIALVQRPAKWRIVARDAFNGVLLWQRHVSTWYPHLINWGQTPPSLQRRLVAIGDRVYATIGYYAPLSALDAATGETLKVYDETRGTEEVIWHKGILLLAVRRVTDERIAQSEELERLAGEKGSPLYARDSAAPLVKEFRVAERKAAPSVLALDADTGRLLWRKDGADAAGLRALTLCASGDRAFYQKGRDVVCLDLKTGKQLWSAPSVPLRLVYDGSVICANGQTVMALSAETGEVLWSQETLLCSVRDAFVINGSLWLGGFKPWTGKKTKWTGPAWGPYFVTQRSLATGEVLGRIEPENPGHHHRCYQNKATDRYILGGRRGTEFIDLESGDVLWNSWARGVCRYGIMPGNGLLYTPPHSCGCYVGAKLEGFNALAAGSAKSAATGSEAPRLERGPAYGSPPSASPSPSSTDWATYRHDAGRSGRTPTPTPPVLRRRWRSEVGGKLTSPTVADGKVFVASVDDHRLCAINADSGQSVWSFTAGGRVDSPPTLYQRRAIFGCRDGHVYSLRASDGALAWRLRVAPEERRIVAREQLESAWPVNGSVLVQDGVAYCTAGRSSYLDGGIDLLRLEPRTGKTLSRTRIYSPDPKTGRQPKWLSASVIPGARQDILTADDSHIYLRDMVFNKDATALSEGSPHLLTLTDFLDDSWAHRSYWIFGTHCSLSTGCSGRDRNLIYGRLLVFDDSTIYGYGRRSVHWSSQLQDGGYRLFAVKRGERAAEWEQPVPLEVRAMVLAGQVLFVAGPPAEPGDGLVVVSENQPALLMAISASDGTVLAKLTLDSCPVFDGMAAAGGRLYISLENGDLVCMAGAKTSERGSES